MTGRICGVYMFAPEHPNAKEAPVTEVRGSWHLRCEPAVTMRAKRVFGRVQQDQSGVLAIRHTLEVARDLAWFSDRYPLRAHDQVSERMLQAAAEQHRIRETGVHQVLTGDQHGEPLPAAPTAEPRDYQLTALRLLRLTGGLLLTDELGLGKTFTGSLNLLHADALPALVVAPTHLASPKGGRWVQEFAEHFPFLRYHVLKTSTPYELADADGNEPQVIITTYAKLAGWADYLAGRIRYVVFDEAQELRRGQGSYKGIAAAQIASRARFTLGMTATPVYNYAGEAHNLIEMISPGTLGSREEFLREWGTSLGTHHIRVADPHALGSYLREQGVMLGRTRADVGRELPKTIKVHQSVDTDPAALDAVAGDAAAMARLILDQTARQTDRFRAGGDLDMVMRQATGIAKAPYVAQFVRLLLSSESRVMLFGWHRAVYDIWMDQLAEFRPVLYTGTETAGQKQRAINAFTYDGNGASRVLIMSLRAGAGVDGLQKHARVAVFGELDWSPQVHEQCIGRLRRDDMGADPVVAYYLLAEEGSDPAIAQVLQVKRQQGEQLVSPDGKLFNNAQVDVSRARLLAEAALAREPVGVGRALSNVRDMASARSRRAS